MRLESETDVAVASRPGRTLTCCTAERRTHRRVHSEVVMARHAMIVHCTIDPIFVRSTVAPRDGRKCRATNK
eukprot:scaffold185581_cov30-Tisochrysis_lutea.AAC.1